MKRHSNQDKHIVRRKQTDELILVPFMRAGLTEHANRTKDSSRSPNLMDLIAMAMDEVQVDSFLLLFLQLGGLCVSRWLIYRAMTLQLHWKH
jgi:hypothetical protein